MIIFSIGSSLVFLSFVGCFLVSSVFSSVPSPCSQPRPNYEVNPVNLCSKHIDSCWLFGAELKVKSKLMFLDNSITYLSGDDFPDFHIIYTSCLSHTRFIFQPDFELPPGMRLHLEIELSDIPDIGTFFNDTSTFRDFTSITYMSVTISQHYEHPSSSIFAAPPSPLHTSMFEGISKMGGLDLIIPPSAVSTMEVKRQTNASAIVVPPIGVPSSVVYLTIDIWYADLSLWSDTIYDLTNLSGLYLHAVVFPLNTRDQDVSFHHLEVNEYPRLHMADGEEYTWTYLNQLCANTSDALSSNMFAPGEGACLWVKLRPSLGHGNVYHRVPDNCRLPAIPSNTCSLSIQNVVFNRNLLMFLNPARDTLGLLAVHAAQLEVEEDVTRTIEAFPKVHDFAALSFYVDSNTYKQMTFRIRRLFPRASHIEMTSPRISVVTTHFVVGF